MNYRTVTSYFLISCSWLAPLHAMESIELLSLDQILAPPPSAENLAPPSLEEVLSPSSLDEFLASPSLDESSAPLSSTESIESPSFEENVEASVPAVKVVTPRLDETIAPSPPAVCIAPPPPEETPNSTPVLYYADNQTYDRELGILILKGHVEFTHEGNILEADFVTYNENADIVTASGNVRLRQADGEINFADYLELTGDMKKGIVLQLRTLLEDDSKIAALEGRKFEDRQELDQAVYTPCELCGDKLPTWQINGRRAVKDDVNKDIIFTDAQFRFFDVPLMYLPFATQPLERRSGFLLRAPDYTTDFGAVFKVPYYFALSEDKDLTLTPVFFTENNPLFLGEYRQAFGSGTFEVEGSITNYKKSEKDKKEEKNAKDLRKAGLRSDFHIPETRGHIFGTYKQNLNDIWRLRLDGGYVSDKTYFRKYKFSGWQTENALTSKGILEGFLNQRDYAAIKTYYFQGLRVGLDHQKRIAQPLPIMEYSAYSPTDPLGGRFKFDGNLLNLYRQTGLNMQRGIGALSWQRPWNTPIGQVFTVFASTRGDLYQVEHENNIGRRERQRRLLQDKDKSVEWKNIEKNGGARFFPQTGFDWRWPFITTFCQQSFVVSPVGQLVAAPDRPIGADNHKIPNQDSQDPEFNDANLFNPDRFPGYDRIDTGSRGVYGGEFLTTGSLFGDIELFLGQSYAFSNHQEARRVRGLKRQASDYVGRIEATPYPWLSFNYRFRLDQKTFNSRIGEVGGSLGPAIAKLSGTYLFVSKHAGTPENRNFSQANLSISSQFTKYWSIVGTVIKNFQKLTAAEKLQKIKNHNGILSEGVGLNYRDDCFGFGFSVTKQNYKSADLNPATIYAVSFWLKNIGDFGTSINPGRGILGDKDLSKKEEKP